MYENTTPSRAPDGRRADRGGRASRTRCTARSARTCRSGGSSCSSARSRRVERHDDGAITIAHLTKSDYEETGALETDSEGVVDHMRAVEGTRVAVLVRELLVRRPRRDAQGVACAPPTASVDVSRVARAFGGGGHPQAAGFSTAVPFPELVEPAPRARARAARGRLAPLPMDGVLLRAKPAGVTSHDVVAERAPRAARAARRSAMPGTLDPFATGLLLVLVGRATRAQRFLMGLPKTYRAVARLGLDVDTGDRDGELTETGRLPEPLEIPVGRAAAAPAGLLGREGGRAARLRAGAARARTPELDAAPGHGPPRRAALARGRARRVRDRVLRRAPTCARSSPTWATPTATSSSGPRSARSGWRTPDPSACCRSREALAFLPERALRAEEAEAVSHGRRMPADESDRGARAAHPRGRAAGDRRAARRASSSPS